MSFQPKKIQKRDGRVVDFNLAKVTKAVFKALEAVGEPNYDLAKELSGKVLEKIGKTLAEEQTPKVEQLQDAVEQVLVEQGLAKVAKAYILYRQKRTEIRKQKQQILEKEEIDEVDKRFDLNALRVLCSRYLRKDPSGRIIESPQQLFKRVALHTALPSIFYSREVFQKEPGRPLPSEDFDQVKEEGNYQIGPYSLNQFHLEGLKRLYDRQNQQGKVKISFSQLLALLKAGQFDSFAKEIEEYYNLMAERKFFPNTPALANFGYALGMGSACFVLPIEDSMESIMEALKKAALIFKAGGGVGYNFSNLRPSGDFIKTTSGKSSGPLVFMELFDKMSDVVKQGGMRRGASMGILDCDHPDIEQFITAKRGNKALRNFNISVLIKPDFWEHYQERKPYPLKNPRDGAIVKYVDPKALFDLIVYQAWESAEPGVIFGDRINQFNPLLEALGPIKAVNPCGEVILYPRESCNLGSINLWAFCCSKPTNGREKDIHFNWQDFQKTIKIATRFLDNVVDINKYPLPEIEEMTLSTRKIGLGIMGLADVLYEMALSYNSAAGLDLISKLMEFLNFYSKVVSVQLARERGSFPLYEKSSYPAGRLPFPEEKTEGILPLKQSTELGLNWTGLKKAIKEYGLRNAFTTVIAPTGSISMIAGASSGAEPNFSLVYEKKVSIGSFYYVNPIFEKVMEREGLFDEDLIKEVCRDRGSIQNLTYIPPRLKKVFITALDLSAEDHIKALAALQRWTDSSISKTINFPSTATIDDMKKAYLLAYELGCKDLTVFRDQSIKGVLSAGVVKEKKAKEKDEADKLVSLKDVKAKGPVVYHHPGADGAPALKDNVNNNGNELCPNCATPLVRSEGCQKCPKCGWGVCTG